MKLFIFPKKLLLENCFRLSGKAESCVGLRFWHRYAWFCCNNLYCRGGKIGERVKKIAR